MTSHEYSATVSALCFLGIAALVLVAVAARCMGVRL
jgi:hypothetical protein